MTVRITIVVGALVACACSGPKVATAAGDVTAGVGGRDSNKAALVAKAKEELGELAKKVGEFEMKNGRCPSGISDVLGSAAAPRDPWGNDVAYMPASAESPSNAFVSAGPDGQLLTSDDITVRAECSR